MPKLGHISFITASGWVLSARDDIIVAVGSILSGHIVVHCQRMGHVRA